MTIPPLGPNHHDIWKCRHGTVVRQCRCPGVKHVRTVPCPIWCKQRENDPWTP